MAYIISHHIPEELLSLDELKFKHAQETSEHWINRQLYLTADISSPKEADQNHVNGQLVPGTFTLIHEKPSSLVIGTILTKY